MTYRKKTIQFMVSSLMSPRVRVSKTIEDDVFFSVLAVCYESFPTRLNDENLFDIATLRAAFQELDTWIYVLNSRRIYASFEHSANSSEESCIVSFFVHTRYLRFLIIWTSRPSNAEMVHVDEDGALLVGMRLDVIV